MGPLESFLGPCRSGSFVKGIWSAIAVCGGRWEGGGAASDCRVKGW